MKIEKFCTLGLSFAILLGAFCKGKSSKDDTASDAAPISWDEARVEASVKFVAAEPHPMGSPRQKQVMEYLKSEAEAAGLEVQLDAFIATVPDPAALNAASVMQTTTLDLEAANVLAKLKVPGSSCVLLVASHYDSKRLEGEISLGANDSGSSTAVVLELMRGLQKAEIKEQLRCSILAVWFDAEEAYLPEWYDGERSHPAKIQDHLYGSRHMASLLTPCDGSMCLPAMWGGEKVKAMLLLDMVGMPNASLTRELHSDPGLLAKAIELDKKVNKGFLYRANRRAPIEDDHKPFVDRGVKALNMIDFNNIETWHTAKDVPESLSSSSMRMAGQLAAALVLDLTREP